jgi:hypothetical protein
LLLKSNKFDHKKNDLFEVRKFSWEDHDYAL